MNSIDKINTVAGLKDGIPMGLAEPASQDVGKAQSNGGEGTYTVRR
jgi:hypothetical protein